MIDDVGLLLEGNIVCILLLSLLWVFPFTQLLGDQKGATAILTAHLLLLNMTDVPAGTATLMEEARLGVALLVQLELLVPDHIFLCQGLLLV